MKFKSPSGADVTRVLALYESAFPPDERRNYADVADFLRFTEEKRGKFHCLVAEEDGDFAGFITYWRFKGFVYVEHFAVPAELRGRNLGSKILSLLAETAGPDILLEVELPESDDARRRIRFYERNGYRVRDEIEYIQPPYSPDQQPLPLLLMTHGDVRLKGPDDLAEMLREVYGSSTAILRN